MDIQVSREQMEQALHIMFQDDEVYNAHLVEDLSEEEYKRFLEECPEFLEDQ